MDDYPEPATHIQVENDYGSISETSSYEDYCYDEPAQVEEEPPMPIDVYTTISEIGNGRISLTTSNNIKDSKYNTISIDSTELQIINDVSDSHQQNGIHNVAFEKTSHLSDQHTYTQANNNEQEEEEDDDDDDEESVDTEAEEVFRAVSGHSCNSETGDEKIPSNEHGKIVCGRNKVLVIMILICFSVLTIFVLLYIMTTTDVVSGGTKDNTTTTVGPLTSMLSKNSITTPPHNIDLSKTTKATTATLSPFELCQTATNFTRSWRLEHNGTDHRPGTGKHFEAGYACDLHEDLQWFRFTGEAGNKMLDTCPPYLSCGTKNPFWTDAEMPQEVGVVTYTTAYGASETDCRALDLSLLVIRCSADTDTDFIYKYNGEYREKCYSAFCGMT